jgi:hypothetical protein
MNKPTREELIESYKQQGFCEERAAIAADQYLQNLMVLESAGQFREFRTMKDNPEREVILIFEHAELFIRVNELGLLEHAVIPRQKEH